MGCYDEGGVWPKHWQKDQSSNGGLKKAGWGK